MRIFYFLTITCIFFTIELSAQTGRFICKNDDGYSSDWIEFFDNGRFKFVHDEQCYAYINGAGIFKSKNDSIQLEFFKVLNSTGEVTELQNSDKRVDITIRVYSLQDSNAIQTATVFARDTSRQEFEFIEKVDSNGSKFFPIPEGKTIKYLRVYADNYIDYEIAFMETYSKDYSIVIYLSEDPLQKSDYNGTTHGKEVILWKGKNKIVYKGKIYKKRSR